MEHENPNLVRVPVKEWASKYSSKSECYQFVCMELHAYLPGKECVSVYYLRDLIQGKRKIVNVSSIFAVSSSMIRATK